MCVPLCVCVCAYMCLIDYESFYFSVKLSALNFANLGNSSYTAITASYLQGVKENKSTKFCFET